MLAVCGAFKCVSMSDQERKVRVDILNINSNEPTFYPYSIHVKLCRGICYDINNLYARFIVPHVVKNMNIKVFNLMID